jgi:hypothetical protein
MSSPAPTTDHNHTDDNHYEQACSQAIAMCNGDLRSTIKALIMANEYLETELQQWHHAKPGKLPEATREAA